MERGGENFKETQLEIEKFRYTISITPVVDNAEVKNLSIDPYYKTQVLSRIRKVGVRRQEGDDKSDDINQYVSVHQLIGLVDQGILSTDFKFIKTGFYSAHDFAELDKAFSASGAHLPFSNSSQPEAPADIVTMTQNQIDIRPNNLIWRDFKHYFKRDGHLEGARWHKEGMTGYLKDVDEYVKWAIARLNAALKNTEDKHDWGRLITKHSVAIQSSSSESPDGRRAARSWTERGWESSFVFLPIDKEVLGAAGFTDDEIMKINAAVTKYAGKLNVSVDDDTHTLLKETAQKLTQLLPQIKSRFQTLATSAK